MLAPESLSNEQKNLWNQGQLRCKQKCQKIMKYLGHAEYPGGEDYTHFGKILERLLGNKQIQAIAKLPGTLTWITFMNKVYNHGIMPNPTFTPELQYQDPSVQLSKAAQYAALYDPDMHYYQTTKIGLTQPAVPPAAEQTFSACLQSHL